MSDQFTIDLTKFCEKAKRNSQDVVKKIVLDMARRIVERSPVGDATYWKNPPPPGYVGGRFRANWQHGTGTMPKEQFQEVANVSMARVESSVNKANPFSVHYIVNNLPYSLAIENGWSWHQAPQGVVGLTVLEYDNVVKAAAKAVNR